MTVLVEDMGMVYRLTDLAYRRMLTDLSNGEGVNLVNYGKIVGIIEANITDMGNEEARHLLRNEYGPFPRRKEAK